MSRGHFFSSTQTSVRFLIWKDTGAGLFQTHCPFKKPSPPKRSNQIDQSEQRQEGGVTHPFFFHSFDWMSPFCLALARSHHTSLVGFNSFSSLSLPQHSLLITAPPINPVWARFEVDCPALPSPPASTSALLF